MSWRQRSRNLLVHGKYTSASEIFLDASIQRTPRRSTSDSSICIPNRDDIDSPYHFHINVGGEAQGFVDSGSAMIDLGEFFRKESKLIVSNDHCQLLKEVSIIIKLTAVMRRARWTPLMWFLSCVSGG